jgi:hypothetical protein
MVVEDPQNRVFVIRNGGFVSFGANGRFKILAVVDTLNLGASNAVYEDSASNRTLDSKQEVKTSTTTHDKSNMANQQVEIKDVHEDSEG